MDNDINRIAADLNYDLSNEARRTVLKCVETKDIQAGPGCGKTTLLVAKLGILASKWVWRDRGVCVLSHMNVARKEIETKVASHRPAQRLLGYPHFVNTIQTFVDTFLAIPYLRSTNRSVTFIDNERYKAFLLQRLGSVRYSTVRSFLQRKFQGRTEELESFVGGLRYHGSNLELDSAGFSRHIPGSATPSYEQLSQLKREATKAGFYRFDDMYAFAEAYLGACPGILTAVQYRFPWVFVDEFQDTDQKQMDLLGQLFSQNCILQRFGDSNQAIFSAASRTDQTELFGANALDVQGSIRFGPTIAQFASQLAVRPVRMDGNAELRDGNHTVFIFAHDRIQRVLPAFGDLLLDEYPQFPAKFVAKAVGAIHKIPSERQATRIPSCVGDYWSEYIRDVAKPTWRPDSLIASVRKARHLVEESGELAAPIKILMEGTLDYLRNCGVPDERGGLISLMTLKSHLARCDRSVSYLLKHYYRGAIFGNPANNETQWVSFTAEFTDCLHRIIAYNPTPSATAFLAWESDVGLLTEVLPERRIRNRYVHDRGGRSVMIELGTIHSVKGETHTATLVFETFYRNHDLKAVLPFLVENVQANRHNNIPHDHMKRIFVGISRPRELVCLAIRNDHVTDNQRRRLVELGWRVQDV